MFGHLASWQTVCSLPAAMSSRTWLKASPVGSRRFSQSGLRPVGGLLIVLDIISIR
jgi:hypothetical protein